ncbi:MAG: hypothetical protein ABI883_03430, partial [Chthoniobacterales bacterium]
MKFKEEVRIAAPVEQFSSWAQARKFILPLCCLALAVLYCWALELGPIESARALGGGLALWLPLGGWLYLLLRRAVPDRTLRLAFASGASYALTTVAYFGAASLRSAWLFPLAQVFGAIGLIAYGLMQRKRWLHFTRSCARFDWLLATLVAASMVANLGVQSVWRPEGTSGNMIYRGFPDQLYHVAQAYELSRHVPPRQAMIRGGTPERAYHHLMAMTTMLVGRYSAQPDLLRAHFIYHYAAIQILICLLLYGMGKTLTGSPVAGYGAIALMYLVLAPAPNLWSGGQCGAVPAFYFTLFPQLSSGIDPVAIASPQMYSGLVLLFTGLLGLLLALQSRARDSLSILFWTIALVFAALVRVRIHFATLVLPPFLLAAFILWWKRRQLLFLSAAAGAILLAGLLYLEMTSEVYLQGTGSMRWGFNPLSAQAPFLTCWPFASTIRAALQNVFHSPEWIGSIWETISLLMFTFLNVVGLPLSGATVFALFRHPARSKFSTYNLVAIGSIAVSLPLALLISTEYDKFSFGGQLPLHTRWYLFPFAGVALASAWEYARRKLPWPDPFWAALAGAIIFAGVAFRLAGPPSSLRVMTDGLRAVIPAEEWLALTYLRDHTPGDSIVLANHSW